MSDLERAVEKHREKLQRIKLFLTDIDGVLTDGRIYWASEEVGFNRFFCASDGYGLKIMMQAGIKVGVISGGESVGVLKRFRELKLDFIKVGDEDKRRPYLEILEASGLSDSEALYIGDEFFDLPLLKRVGFSAAPPHADPEVQAACDYVTTREGGRGCVREVVNLVRLAQGIVPVVPDF